MTLQLLHDFINCRQHKNWPKPALHFLYTLDGAQLSSKVSHLERAWFPKIYFRHTKKTEINQSSKKDEFAFLRFSVPLQMTPPTNCGMSRIVNCPNNCTYGYGSGWLFEYPFLLAARKASKSIKEVRIIAIQQIQEVRMRKASKVQQE